MPNVVARVQHELSHLRGRKARNRAIQDFRRSLALIVDSDALEASVATRLKELFDPEVLVLLHLEPSAGTYRPSILSGARRSDVPDVAIGAQGRLARWFLVNESCLLIPHDHGVFAYLEPSEREFLTRLHVKLCAPLLARNHVAGMLLLGWHRRRRPPTRRDADLLMDLAHHASLAFQNAALYREQQQRLEDLHRAERFSAIGQLTSSVAHEVGNPLTAIRSTMQYLVARFDTGDRHRELMQEVIGEVDRIRETINSMLSLTRQQDLQPAVDVDLVEVLQQTLHLVEVKARKQGVSFEELYDSPLRVTADPNQLRQVFLNLVLNSLQAMPEGGRLTISTRREPSPATGGDGPAVVRISIADTGIGIPEHLLGRIFERFFTTKTDGTGLGLAICRDIVLRHQGRIDVDSAEGQGTTVSLELPLGPRDPSR